MNGRFDRWATILMLLVGGLLLLVPLGSFITQDTWPQLFEVGAHHIPMRDWPSWLRAGQTVGWDHTFFNGHPTYQFYFPAPALGWMLLDVVLPAHTAYILVTVLPIPAMLWAAYWLARSWSLGRPSAVLFAASVILVWGEWLLPSAQTSAVLGVLYGQFSHGWAMVAALCFLASANRAVGRERWGRWAVCAGVLLAVCVMSHPIVGIVAGGSMIALVCRDTVRKLAAVAALALGLSAWWWVPAVGQAWISATREQAKPSISQVFGPVIWACLPVAAWGVYRLWQRLPERRVLYPAVFVGVVPVAYWLVTTKGDVFGYGGRTLAFWYLLIPALAIWAVLNYLADRMPPGWAAALAAGVVCALGIAYPFLLKATIWEVGWIKAHDAIVVDNHRPLPDCGEYLAQYRTMRPSTFMYQSTGYWSPEEGCDLLIGTGIPTLGIVTPVLGEQHRTLGGTLLESAPINYFLWGTHLPHDLPVEWTATQLMTLGVDYYLVDSRDQLGGRFAKAEDAGDLTVWKVEQPPPAWPSTWQDTSQGKWIERSLRVYNGWEDPTRVSIPVLGTPPAGTSDAPPLWTVRPDWSDDRYVRFDASQAGFYYIPVSYHPNWKPVSPDDQVWRAGPNQMVIHTDTPGETALRFTSSGWERSGQAITMFTLLALAAVAGMKHRRQQLEHTPGHIP